jgi:hypothetical protein
VRASATASRTDARIDTRAPAIADVRALGNARFRAAELRDLAPSIQQAIVARK